MTLIIYRNMQPNNAGGVYGSKIAGQFLQDLVAGRDSLDIVCIGDSNIGRGNYGYVSGFNRVLNYGFGVPYYATPLLPGSMRYGPTSQANAHFQPGVTLYWCGHDATGTSVQTLVEATNTGSGTPAHALKSFLGFDATNPTNDGTTRLPLMQWGAPWYGAYVPSGVTYTSAANNNYIRLSTAHPLNYGSGTGGVNLTYRVVHGTFTTAGSFKLLATTTGNTVSGSFSTGSVNGYDTKGVDFTSASGTLSTVQCTWDGANSGNSVTGPFACLFHSISAKSAKGCCVNTLLYQSGRTTTGVADTVEYMDKLLDAYLQELRVRQTLAGGSGRVLVFVNMGINDAASASATAYTNAANRIINRISSRWSVTNGTAENLAFVFTPSHPTTSAGNANWASLRPALAAGVNAWASSAAGNTCVVDLASNYSAYRLNNDSLYETGDQAHLNATTTAQNNGYDAVAGNIVSLLLASV